MTRREQTKAIKTALIAKGYPVLSVKHGTGTAYCWIHIKLAVEWSRLNKYISEVESIAAKILGRESWAENCIIVDS